MPAKAYDYAVYIGRFQPPHRGHVALIRQAAALADCLIVALGSADAAPSTRNPFSFGQRQAMIKRLASGLPATVRCVPINDSAYNLNEWLVTVKNQVQACLNLDARPNARVALVGAFKDASSFYLKHFPEWPLVELAVQGDYNSTAVRRAMFEEFGQPSAGVDQAAGPATGHLSGRPTDSARLQSLVEPAILDYLGGWAGSAEFAAFSEEYAAVEAYRHQWANAPYPPVFVTADAVVLCSGHVLLVRRGRQPGKGLLAFPGGFLEANESLLQAGLRELVEETGLDGGLLDGRFKLAQLFDEPQRDARGRMITQASLYDLGCRPELPTLRPGDDAAEALWFPLRLVADAGGQFFADHHRILRYFLNRP
ncbi:MAG: hypothetical protein A2087_13285 [Spirochaetes bacterium GWD1_61_31]|nr:MAG: hypothetical protein A2Y37_02690 [Spirochaetes bacterium GWB1_60_80]OHD31282.1 MAG: hypothetical protein A2004_13565 [Spirochaetes bacterium GWC1_61_12]OHD39466.1 MAG: hypothetical protein A2087_13285 [Spirochaetes bacterium GWD1_61_31]OHD45518.1 MAG: hypothetical protein A2Y35_02960 [Spirochaetes bacterium GWE1_60_18]OHD58091.1 MAG: hypothetical protein A2Y32_05535 [Spirochaetes bacterium GWF1_60_12]HAP44662.1 hypothetical protein [Spirochaetaceae bacterium]